MAEAAELQDGADGLGALARERGAVDAWAYRDWVGALVRADRLGDATEAAREALARTAGGRARAAVAELL